MDITVWVAGLAIIACASIVLTLLFTRGSTQDHQEDKMFAERTSTGPVYRARIYARQEHPTSGGCDESS